MGIPICVRLAELMGGTIELADRGDGPGARFTLRLPLRVPPAPGASVTHSVLRLARPARVAPVPSAAAAAARDLRGTRVLAVDDSPANLRYATFVLRRLGCAVETCSDGDEVVAALARAAAAGAPFDVVVMDFYMARMNGDAALAALRAAGHAALPVLLCTGNATAGDVARGAAMGFAGTLGKPFSAEAMATAVAAALRR
jgi:two-component system sensor histidine kinase/response regulator